MSLPTSPNSSDIIPVADSDGDVGNLADVIGGPGTSAVYDPGEASEGEQNSLYNVGGQGVDLSGLNVLHSGNVGTTALTQQQVATSGAQSVAESGLGALGGSAFTGPYGIIIGAVIGSYFALKNEADSLTTAYNQQRTQADPFDANYKTVYTPITPPAVTSPTFPTTSTLPVTQQTALQNDLMATVTALQNVASASDAVYVTQNRLLSAYQMSDLASFILQNTALNTFVATLASDEIAQGKAESALATDLSNIGTDLTITPTQITAFQNSLRAGGFAALPAQEQSIIQTYSLSTSDQQALVSQLVAIEPTTVPTSFDADLTQQATMASQIGTALTVPPVTNPTIPPLLRNFTPDPGAVLLNGTSSQYIIADNNGSLYIQDTMTGRDGTQTLPAGVTEIAFTDGPGVFDPAGTAEDVARIYGATLGRGPDVVGLEYWTAQVDSSNVPLSVVATSFTASPEFIQDYGSLSDASFVNQLYENVLGRAADAAGAQYWDGVLASGASRGTVVLGFAESQENDAKTLSTAGDVNNAEAYRLYQAALNRTPDAPGLSYWSSTLANGATPTQVAQDFINSPEFQQDYGALSASDFVSTLYQNVLHRAADPAGLQYWTGQVQQGSSEASVLVGFSDSLENRTQTASATHANWVFIPA